MPNMELPGMNTRETAQKRYMEHLLRVIVSQLPEGDPGGKECKDVIEMRKSSRSLKLISRFIDFIHCIWTE